MMLARTVGGGQLLFTLWVGGGQTQGGSNNVLQHPHKELEEGKHKGGPMMDYSIQRMSTQRVGGG